MSALGFIIVCVIGIWIFSYLADRKEGKSEKESYDEAGKHLAKEGPGLIIYIIAVFAIGGVLSFIFG